MSDIILLFFFFFNYAYQGFFVHFAQRSFTLNFLFLFNIAVGGITFHVKIKALYCYIISPFFLRLVFYICNSRKTTIQFYVELGKVILSGVFKLNSLSAHLGILLKFSFRLFTQAQSNLPYHTNYQKKPRCTLYMRPILPSGVVYKFSENVPILYLIHVEFC